MPKLQLWAEGAEEGVELFDSLRLPDVQGFPLLRDSVGDWFREMVGAVCGSLNPETKERMIRELFALVPKGQSKTTYGAALMVVLLQMNERPRAELLFVAPTQSIADQAFSQASGMIEADPELTKLFEVIPHQKIIRDRLLKSMLRIKTFDLNVLTGTRPVVVLVDELHLLGRKAYGSRVMRQIRGGLEKNPESLLVIITTQSDEAPAGVFKDELLLARKIRDGKYSGRMLPILYEFPEKIAHDKDAWMDPSCWSMVMPNLGKSMWLDSLVADWEVERLKGDHAIRVWASQHLNIEIGIGLKSDGWAGAEYWERSTDPELTLEAILERSEVIVVGVDGGGLDDLYGVSIVGRETIKLGEKETKRWLSWSHAWCHHSVLTRRQSIAARLQDFANDEELTIVDNELDDTRQIVALISRINELGLLSAVAVDMEGPYGELIDELALVGVSEESDQLIGVGQGYRLMNAIKTSERKLANGTMVHAPSRMMEWCVGNIKIEPTATAIRATKQNAGDAKIDPAMALFDAVSWMTTNPEASDGGMSGYFDSLEMGQFA